MKIKTKKQLNLPQLIEWAMDNDMHDKSFCGYRYGDAVHFDENEDMLCDHVSLNEIFTVEVEEEITEDTVIDKLVAIDSDNDALVFSNYTIKEIKNSGFKEFHAYIDGEFKLIWTKEKGLVE